MYRVACKVSRGSRTVKAQFIRLAGTQRVAEAESTNSCCDEVATCRAYPASVFDTQRAEDFAQLGVHGKTDALARRRLAHEPFVVGLEQVAVPGDVLEAPAHGLRHLRVIFAKHQTVGIERQELADDHQVGIRLVARDQSVKQDIVGSKGVCLTRCHEVVALLVVSRADDVDAKRVFFVEALQGRFVRGTGSDHDHLAREIAVRAVAGLALHHELGAGDVHDGRECHLFGAFLVGRGGATLEVDLARFYGLHARLGCDELITNLHLLLIDLALDFVDHRKAQVNRVADRAGFREVGQRKGGLTIAQRDGAGGIDLGERSFELVGLGFLFLGIGSGQEQQPCGPEQNSDALHRILLSGAQLADAGVACGLATYAGLVASSGSACTPGVSGESSSSPSSPSHFATTAVAMELPTTLVALRPMSRNWSMPMIRSRPASGILKVTKVAAITTREARGTPAIPLLVTISNSSMVICCANDSSMP